MNVHNEIVIKKRNSKILPKIKNEYGHKRDSGIKKEDAILLYKKHSVQNNIKDKQNAANKKKTKKLRFISVGTENKKSNVNVNIIENNNVKIKKFNSNEFLDKKSQIRELSQKKKLFSERVKLIKIMKRNKSPKPRQETSFELIKRYSLKVLVTNRSTINNKKEKDINDKIDYNGSDNLNGLPRANIKKPRNLPPLLKENYSSINLLSPNKNYHVNYLNNMKSKNPQLHPINKRYLMIQYSGKISQQKQNQEKLDNSYNFSNINISSNRSVNLNQINLKGKIINLEKELNNEKLPQKIKIDFSFKEYNYLNYAIVPGNASYLVKNCMLHRTNWKESFSSVTNMFNFKWQQNTNGISYSKLGKYGNIRQVVNHFENHFALSNKANMFINMMFYCEQRKISVFKYVPLTIVFELDILNNTDNEYKKKLLEKLKKFVDENESIYVKDYEQIGSYFREENFKLEKKKRIEYIIKRNEKKNWLSEYFYLVSEEEKNKFENEKFHSNYPIYIDYFGKPELIERVGTTLDFNLDSYNKMKEFEMEMKDFFGIGTIIEIPETHYAGKNMWIIKAINLCQGKCIQIAHNFNQMLAILNKFKEGVEYNFTEKVIEEKQEIVKAQGKNDKKIDKDSLYCCNKIIIQKYIEKPLLYKGRKCDMRVWVLVTHTMKAYFFKEGHLKTCSISFDINSKDAYTHITNYSFQKHNANFQKYEKGNEVPFYDFQKFIDKNYPQRQYNIKRDLYNQIKEIISISMMSVREQINKNKRNYQFEIFGYDFMLDEDFNLFLIEINDDPGLEESSPWIQIIVPRMLDDALRLTIDQIFYPTYDFSKKYKKEKKEDNFKKIAKHFKKNIEYKHKYIETENNLKKENKIQNKDIEKKTCFTDNNNLDILNNNKGKKDNNINKITKNNNYISPFPVPGYKNDENLWEFVCDLNGEDPLDIYLDKKHPKENSSYTGIKYLQNKKKN